MISSVSAWSNALSTAAVTKAKKQEERLPFMQIGADESDASSARTAAELPASLGADNGVKSSIVAAELGIGGDGASAGAASGGGAAGGEGEETKLEIIYNTVVLPDGSKLVQVITKYPDGSTHVTTTKMPGQEGDESGFSKELRSVIREQEEEGRDAASSGAGALEQIAVRGAA